MPDKQAYDGVVVGSGPNGLAAAITLAQAGRSVLLIEGKDTVGGGMRSAELTLPGFVHDVCSTVHPLGMASPFFQSIDLASHGLEWITPPSALAHPLDDGTAVLLEPSIDDTSEMLGSDARAYRGLMKPMARHWHHLLSDIFRPPHFPLHPFTIWRFGPMAIQSAEYLARSGFKGERARALFAGMAAHSIMPLDRTGSAAFVLTLGAAAHAGGWPIAKGGSQQIADSLKRHFVSLGGEVRTGTPVTSMRDLPQAPVKCFDVTPRQLASIASDGASPKYGKRLSRFAYGPGVFKMDWALDGPIPWKAVECLQSATVHVGGTFDEIAEAEDDVCRGRHPQKPLVILAQQSLFDAGRVPQGRQSAWAYCHVPNGSEVDMSERIENQIERFAPGFRDRIIARSVMSTAEMQSYNPNCVGGDIAGGAQNPLKLMMRPLGQWQAYVTPIRGVYLCSASMPPGAGVHGMCGHHAARRALRDFS